MKKFYKRKNSKVETIRGNLAEVFGIHNVFLMGKTNKPFCKVCNLLRSFKIRTFKIKYWSRINTKLFYLQDKKRLGGKRTDKHKENVKKSFTMERIQRRKPFEEIHTCLKYWMNEQIANLNLVTKVYLITFEFRLSTVISKVELLFFQFLLFGYKCVRTKIIQMYWKCKGW